jgi:hypothetical protein
MKYKCLCILGLIYSLNSCSSKQKPSTETSNNRYAQIQSLNWLLGNWQNDSQEGIAIESWTQLNDSTFAGYSHYIIANDTVSSEQISFQQHGSDLYYIPTVKEQNDNLPVSFKLSFFADSTFVCENRAHDFPQKIEYTLINKDSIVASISGLVNDTYKEVFFPMKRVQESLPQ